MDIFCFKMFVWGVHGNSRGMQTKNPANQKNRVNTDFKKSVETSCKQLCFGQIILAPKREVDVKRGDSTGAEVVRGTLAR